jgi:hypothetical protein
MLCGTALCNLTFGNADFRLNMARLVGTNRTKQVKIIDNGGFKYFKDSTGTLAFNAGGLKLTCDSSCFIVDSLYTQTNDTIQTQKLLIGPVAKLNINSSLFYFGAALADTLTNSANLNVKVVTVNKTGLGLVQAGKSTYTVLRISDGTFAQLAVTDTTWCDSLVWTSTDTSTLIAPVIVSTGISVATGCKIGIAATSYIRMTTCTAATLNGNSVRIYYPTISPIAYPNSSTFADKIGTPSTHALTISGCSLGKDSTVIIGTPPAGYSITKSTGTISWSGVGSTGATTILVRSYGNAKTDSASVTVTAGVVAAPVSGHRRRVMGLGLGLGMF